MKKDNEEFQAFVAKVEGRVQGVGFRYSTMSQARKIGVTGYVRNMADGSVEVRAEGEAAKLATLLEWLRIGPSGAFVSNVEFRYISYSGAYRDFIVTY